MRCLLEQSPILRFSPDPNDLLERLLKKKNPANFSRATPTTSIRFEGVVCEGLDNLVHLSSTFDGFFLRQV